MGPVEYIVVGFPGNEFNGQIAPELIALVESGTVRILDLIFIGKDAEGDVLAFEIDEHHVFPGTSLGGARLDLGQVDPRARERLEDALAREVREETGIEIEVGPILEANQGYRWQRIELVYAYRPLGGTERLSEELVEVRAFDPADLPDVRADQRGIIERRATEAAGWARRR